MQFLGETIEEIAWHKCGIIKSGTKVYSYMPQNEKALNVIRQTCDEQNAQLITTGDVKNVDKTCFTYDGDEWEISMKGSFQPYNAALAIEVLKGLGVENKHIKKGLKDAFQPCRFQVVRENPYLIFDGAHNISGCQALADSIKSYLENKPVIIFGMADDKQYKECIKLLAPLAQRFIVTGFENSRATDIGLLKAEAEKYCDKVECVKSVSELSLNSAECDTVVCGSLYLVSEAAKQAGI